MRELTPAAVAAGSRCLHSWAMECQGDPTERRAPDAGVRLRMERSESARLRRLGALPDVSEPSSVEATRSLMARGAPWIHRGILLRDGLRARPELLKRIEAPSALGNHSYLPVEIREFAVAGRDVYELLADAWALEPILGCRPDRGGWWLPGKEIEEVDLSPFAERFERLLTEMDRVGKGELRTTPFRCGECSRCAWQPVCDRAWRETEDLSLLRRVSPFAAARLREAGFATWRTVAEAGPERIIAAGFTEESARELWLNARAWQTGRPQSRRPAIFPEGVPIYFYDVETYRGRTYLHGVIRLFEGRREERQFLAPSPEGESRAWQDFLDYMARDSEALVYSWTEFERGIVHPLHRKYGGNPAGWKHLESRLVDQCRFVKDHFWLPTYSYSIKKVAPLFGFHWEAPDANGLNAEAWYQEWLQTGDEMILRKIMRYNRDDVAAMERIHRALAALPEEDRHISQLPPSVVGNS